MNLKVHLPSPITHLEWPFVKELGESTSDISICCKRDDLIHPFVSGNKWRKLTIPLALIKKMGHQHIISFGGPYSNHLHALSYACKNLNIQLTAVIRGNYITTLNPTLSDMKNWGTNLHFVSKIEYKNRYNKEYCSNILAALNADYLIPEGGSSVDCLEGVDNVMKEIYSQVPNITHIVLPVASGGTLAGLVTSQYLPNVKLIGIGVLKGKDYLESLVEELIALDKRPNTKHRDWQILHDFHHGGYAKVSAELKHFVEHFNIRFAEQSQQSPLCIEPIYSGKCFYALNELLKIGFFPKNSKVLIVHTGGIQGARESRK